MSTATQTQTFTLHNNEIEDEADCVAVTYEVRGAQVIVTARYRGYPEWETPLTMTREDARKDWKHLQARGWTR